MCLNMERMPTVIDDWEGHPDTPVSDAELRALIAEDAGFGTNPFTALHGITSSVEGLEK